MLHILWHSRVCTVRVAIFHCCCRWYNASGPVPYTEPLALQDWAPFNYWDGYYGDLGTKGNKYRSVLVPDSGSEVLDVLLPKDCLKSECAMQVKTALKYNVEEATLKYR